MNAGKTWPADLLVYIYLSIYLMVMQKPKGTARGKRDFGWSISIEMWYKKMLYTRQVSVSRLMTDTQKKYVGITNK